MKITSRALVAAAALCAAAPVLAQQGPSTYTLSAEQKVTLAEAVKAATYWYAVRASAVQSTGDAYAFGLAQRDIAALMNALAAQDQAAAKAAADKAEADKTAAEKPAEPK